MAGAWEIGAGAGYPLVIATPSRGQVNMSWALHMGMLQKPTPTRWTTFLGAPIDVARNALVRDALNVKAEYLLFLDDDVYPPLDVFQRLLSWRLPVVSGLYWGKRGAPCVWRRQMDGWYTPVLPAQWGREQLIECDAVPGGCLLIDMRLFSKVSFPWFNWTIDDPYAERPDQASEDFGFSQKVQEAGYKLFVDVGIQCLHETQVQMQTDGKVIFPQTVPALKRL